MQSLYRTHYNPCLKVLLVLDDVWETRHEKPLHVIDQDNASKLLVTTRIRGIVKGASEVDVGTLSDREALELLCATAGIELESLDEDEEARGLVNEVVTMTGKLTLTVAIVGGMILEFGGAVDESFVEMLQEEGLRTQEEDTDDGDGMTVEDRVIRSSLAMIGKGGKKKKSDEQTLSMQVPPSRNRSHT